MTNRWEEEYKHGAHWEKETSSQMQHFIKYLKPNYLILDAGCGSGRDSLFLATKGYKVIGIDISKIAIKKAKIRAKEEGLTIQFDIGNLDKLPYKNEQFDAIYSGYTLQHTNLESSSRELARVVKKGRIAYIVMFEKTLYENSSKYNHKIDHQYILDIFKRFFNIIKVSLDEYTEDDQHGKHKHTRLVLVLQKR